MEVAKGVGSPRDVRWRWIRIAAALVLANLGGAVFVFAYLVFIAPTESGPGSSTPIEDVTLFVAFCMLVFPVTAWWINRVSRPARLWCVEQREPTPEERRLTLRFPAIAARRTFVPWAIAAAFFSVGSILSGESSAAHVIKIAVVTLDGGLVTCAICFLAVERVMRPVFALAMTADVSPPQRKFFRGAGSRVFLMWLLGSAVPLAGLALLPVAAIGADERTDIRVAVAVLAGAGLLAGLLVALSTARSIGLPLRNVRRALERVAAGDLSVQVPVDSPGDIGQLEYGVNQMVAGLRERARLEDLFGRHVGTEVASLALEQGTGLETEQREATALFVDIIGSTAMAEVLDPQEVVERLNAFFGAVVRTVTAEGGWVNKFEGDGALCVFGAPAVQPDHAERALRAARRLHTALAEVRAEHPGLEAGIGVSSGTVVVGNVGAESRYEYTVIGVPVNEAARLTDLAKGRPGRVLASQASLDRAPGERHRWTSVGTVALRGQSAPTTLLEPLDVRHSLANVEGFSSP